MYCSLCFFWYPDEGSFAPSKAISFGKSQLYVTGRSLVMNARPGTFSRTFFLKRASDTTDQVVYPPVTVTLAFPTTNMSSAVADEP